MKSAIYKTNSIFEELDLSALKHFYAIAIYGGFSKASRATGSSQPALSLGLKKLEKTLGVTLINRNSREFALTKHGLTLLGFCQRLEGSLETMVTALGVERLSIKKRIRIGTALSIGVDPLISVCARAVQGEHPLDIEISSQNTYSLLSELAAGSYDAALVSDDVYEAALTFTRLKEDRLVFIAGPKVSRAFKNAEWPRVTPIIPLITYPRETPMRSLVDRLGLQYQTKFKTVFSANNMDAIKAMVAGNVGGAYVLKSLVRRELAEGALVEIKTPFELPKSGIALATRKGEEGNALSKLLAGWIKF